MRAGSTAQEFGEFLKQIEQTGKDTASLWAWLVRIVYDEFIFVGNVCSITVCLWVLGHILYNGTQIIQSLKQRAFVTTVGTVLRAFCCGVAAFVTDPKYSQVPGLRTVEDGWEGTSDDNARMGEPSMKASWSSTRKDEGLAQ